MRPFLDRAASVLVALTLLITATACSILVDPDEGRLGQQSGVDGGPPPDAFPGVPCDLECDDGIVCTVDRCLDGACVHQRDDGACGGPGDACVGIRTCDPPRSANDSGCVFGAPIECDDGVPCTDDECDPESGTCRFVPDHGACDDGIDCTLDLCDPSRDDNGCTHAADDAICDDGFCRSGGRCDPARGCTGGTARDCSDTSRCTTDRCDEVLAMCVRTVVDADGDGFTAQRVLGESCIDGTDCDDARAAVHPGATEVCSNAIDDDCDGAPDDGCGGCRPIAGACPSGWTYSNDGRDHTCSVSFTPPFGVREYCRYSEEGVLGFYWMLAVPYNCPSGARYAPNAATGYCLWEGLTLPAGATIDCTSVGSGRMSFRWPC
ncbi:MopE-related protein [Sandaracinus amylolyticus]|uniref:MopE-related protein n=1 Tax=Sandaracinus amylolyticus TaxID=927083 RepID=UPI001F163961|nr:MopE-related protein [Sandaracinus amylolyticus]UJR84061.1 Hypothetical protein I5071_61320 [Sandaracinus amylolyticus]